MNKHQIFQKYKQLKNNPVFCPILNRKVSFTRQGWDHIVRGTKAKRRNLKDKNIRLGQLKNIAAIIKYADETTLEVKNGIKYIDLRVRIKKLNFKTNIKVVLKEDKTGKLIFYSVMKTKK